MELIFADQFFPQKFVNFSATFQRRDKNHRSIPRSHVTEKVVATQKRGETRALWLGLGMMACSAMMYLFIGIVLVPLHRASVWADESECNVVTANIKEKVHCSFIEGSEDKNIFHYPCLEIYVNLTRLGQLVMLYHTEITVDRNPKCSYIPPDMENYKKVQQHVEMIRDNFRKHQRFLCHYDPSRKEKSVLFKRLYPPEGLLIAFAWPTVLLIGGILIVILVKLSQYLALVSAKQRRTLL